jgi:hypothetical protein
MEPKSGFHQNPLGFGWLWRKNRSLVGGSISAIVPDFNGPFRGVML